MTNIRQAHPGFIRDQCDQWVWQLVVILLTSNAVKITSLPSLHHFSVSKYVHQSDRCRMFSLKKKKNLSASQKVSWHLSSGKLPKHKSLSHSSPPTTQLIEQVIVKILGEIGDAHKNIEFLLLINSLLFQMSNAILSQVLKLPVMVLLLSYRHHVWSLMAVLILIYTSKCQIWKERSKWSVGSPYGEL